MSYARADDAYGALTAFRTRLATEVRLHLGREFPIFQDREDLEWGEEWRSRIEGALSEVTFLIPILTPSFFASEACRDELRQFLARERHLGRQDLILPVYYISTPELENAVFTARDELASVLASRQRADWRDLRYEPLDSPSAARAMARLAEQVRSGLDRVQRSTQHQPTGTTVERPQPTLRDDEPVNPVNLPRITSLHRDHTTMADIHAPVSDPPLPEHRKGLSESVVAAGLRRSVRAGKPSRAITGRMLRSILAIGSGFIAIGALSVVTNAVLYSAGILPPDQPITDTWVLVLTLGYVAIYAIFGCYLTASLSPSRPMRHALILGAFGLALNVMTAFSMRGQLPDWYLSAGVLLTVPYAWIGGRLREMQLARGRTNELAANARHT